MNSIQTSIHNRTRKRTVLCIEDELETISLIKLVLERDEFRVIGALNGREGLDLARQADPDVVLLDLMLPGMDGWEISRRMKADEKLKDVPVIALTGVHPSSHSTRDLQVDDYLTKPFAPKNLVRRVKAAVHVSTREAVKAERRSKASG